MGKVKTVVGSGITPSSTRRVVVAGSGQRIARKMHKPKSDKVVVANVDMPQMSETKGKVVKVLY